MHVPVWSLVEAAHAQHTSNPDGWAAITDASSRLGRPHLPNGLAAKLARGGREVLVPAELAERARLVVEAANWFPARATDFEIASGAEPGGLVDLVVGLSRAGLGAEAAAVRDALATVGPELRSGLDGDLMVALARAGLSEQTRAKVADNLARWPQDAWIRIRAGEALLVLGDRDEAAAHFNAAVDLAGATDNSEARSAATERLRRLERHERPGSKPAPGARPANRHGKAGRTRPGRKPGR